MNKHLHKAWQEFEATHKVSDHHNKSSQVIYMAFEAGAKAADQLIQERETVTRQDQIMLDFLSLIVDLPDDVDESVLISWRDKQLKELSKEQN